jgi:hypothetical protein
LRCMRISKIISSIDLAFVVRAIKGRGRRPYEVCAILRKPIEGESLMRAKAK